MKNVNNYFIGILAFCLLSGVFLFLSVSALQDIHSVNDGFNSEWALIKTTYVVNGLLYLFIIMTFLRFRKSLKKSR